MYCSVLNHTPFHKHQDYTSFQNCQRLLTQFYFFLLFTHDHEEFPLPLPDRTMELIGEASGSIERVALVRETGEEWDDPTVDLEQQAFNDLHALFLHVWTRSWVPSIVKKDDGSEIQDTIPDPTIRFLICTQVNADGSIKSPREATGVLAKLTYIMVSFGLC